MPAFNTYEHFLQLGIPSLVMNNIISWECQYQLEMPRAQCPRDLQHYIFADLVYHNAAFLNVAEGSLYAFHALLHSTTAGLSTLGNALSKGFAAILLGLHFLILTLHFIFFAYNLFRFLRIVDFVRSTLSFPCLCPSISLYYRYLMTVLR